MWSSQVGKSLRPSNLFFFYLQKARLIAVWWTPWAFLASVHPYTPLFTEKRWFLSEKQTQWPWFIRTDISTTHISNLVSLTGAAESTNPVEKSFTQRWTCFSGLQRELKFTRFNRGTNVKQCLFITVTWSIKSCLCNCKLVFIVIFYWARCFSCHTFHLYCNPNKRLEANT